MLVLFEIIGATLRQDFFTFTPQFKLLFAGNHKPGLRNVDEAIRRRFHLIPFTVTMTDEERDPDLPEKLKAEWPGILKWAIQGCLDWQRIGLYSLPAVTNATAEYLADEDSFSVWMNECLVSDQYNFETSSVLYGSWKTWAERAGENPGNQKRFTQNMASRGGVSTRRDGGVRGFTGFKFAKPGSDQLGGGWHAPY